jgi:hypothetical protein
MSDGRNGSGVKFSHVLLAICLIGIVFAGTTVGKWAKIGCEIGGKHSRLNWSVSACRCVTSTVWCGRSSGVWGGAVA